LDQHATPIFAALKNHLSSDIIPFHVPGHKYGNGLKEFADFVGDNVLRMDLNSMEDLDNACNPTGVILEAQKLIARAFSADHAFLLINGASSGVQSMIMSTCNPGEEIIVPRNAHKSVVGGIILSGAIPIYIQPEINHSLGIAMGVSDANVEKSINEHPHAKAIFIINPTYYGVASNLKSIVSIAHEHQMSVLVDEAHGTHMYFHDDLPLTSMEAGADLSTISMHKTGGSMTQSAVMLLKGTKIDPKQVKQAINLTFTTSASYILMSSVDVARKQLATKGFKLMKEVLSLARFARSEINKIDGLYSPGLELVGTKGCYDFDETKLTIHVAKLGLTGYEVEKILLSKYKIQIEFADLYNVFLILSIGDKKEYIDALIDAFKDLASNAKKTNHQKSYPLLSNPKLIVSPRDAFYSSKKSVSLDESVGEICGEMIMAYPPGIPVVSLGEKITKDIIDYVKLLKDEKCQLQGTADPYVDHVMVLGKD
jgi:arginine/lysine/ornithine decarboxylase